MQDLQAVGPSPSTDVGDVVLGAEVGGRDVVPQQRAAIGHPGHAFDPHDQNAPRPDCPSYLVDHRAVLVLGQHQAGGGRLGDRGEVTVELVAAGRVDADQAEYGRVGQLRRRGRKQIAGRIFVLLGDRVFEVEDSQVGPAGNGLGDQFRTGRGQEQHAAHDRHV